MDFTIKRYKNLLGTLSDQGFVFEGVDRFTLSNNKIIVLRHDVDLLPERSFEFARIEKEMGIRAVYYFRSVPESWNERIIEGIAGLGHEIGYHYEDLSFVAAKLKAQGTLLRQGFGGQGRAKREYMERMIVEEGIESFGRNLERLRSLVLVKTICMHGSPLSRWDSRLLWKYYDYRDFSIEGEPYFDLNFEEMLYLTDTGRRWNGGSVSVRDKGLGIRDKGLGDSYRDWKVKPKEGSLMRMTEKGIDFQKRYSFKSTNDIIRAAEKNELPARMMMTFHPQRWTNKPLPWVRELVWQNTKNIVKYLLIKVI